MAAVSELVWLVSQDRTGALISQLSVSSRVRAAILISAWLFGPNQQRRRGLMPSSGNASLGSQGCWPYRSGAVRKSLIRMFDCRNYRSRIKEHGDECLDHVSQTLSQLGLNLNCLPDCPACHHMQAPISTLPAESTALPKLVDCSIQCYMHSRPDYLDECVVNAVPALSFNKDDKRQNLGDTLFVKLKVSRRLYT